MSVNPAEIRVFGAASGSDREITVGGRNLRSCWWSASGELFIDIAVNLPFSFKASRTPSAAGATASG